MISIVLTVHDKNWLISAIIGAICKYTVNPFELVVVLDGCSDSSEARVRQCLRCNEDDYHYTKTPPQEFATKTGNYNIVGLRVLCFQPPGLYEVIANNRGMQVASPESTHLILLQDDMIPDEYGWDVRLIHPLQVFPDVFMVTGRNAVDVQFAPPEQHGGVSFPVVTGRVEDGTAHGCIDAEYRNSAHLRHGVNRGPIAFIHDRVCALGYLDELFAPFQFDDVDICLRAWDRRRWRSCSYHVDYVSDLSWGTQRIKMGHGKEYGGSAPSPEIVAGAEAYQKLCAEAQTKNVTKLWERYHNLGLPAPETRPLLTPFNQSWRLR